MKSSLRFSTRLKHHFDQTEQAKVLVENQTGNFYGCVCNSSAYRGSAKHPKNG
jgi:hypothetical protein